MKYRSEIDGLRSVAVLPVILFHAGSSLFSGGFVGVDIFFVISGYLITTIIVDELSRGEFSLLRFYERRAKRILPALCLVSVTALVLGWLLLQNRPFVEFVRSLLGVATFSSNILFWMEADYFDTTAELKPMLHTWSLAVEEQFYIFFPLLLMLFWRFGQKVVLYVLIAIFLVSLALAQWQVRTDPMSAFFLLHARAWELGIGAFCAFYLRAGHPPLAAGLRNGLSGLGLGLIAVAVFGFTAETPTPSLITLVPTVGAALIILFATSGTLVQRLLSTRAMVGVGLISYSAYLWHQPLFAFTRHNSLEEPAWYVMAALIALTLLLAWLSWKYVETPVRKGRYPRFKLFGASATGLAAFAALGFLVHTYEQANYRSGQFNPHDTEISLLDYENDNVLLHMASYVPLRKYSRQLACLGNCETGYSDQAWYSDDPAKLRLLVVGNSHARDLFNMILMSDRTMQSLRPAPFFTEIADVGPDSEMFGSRNYRDADAVMIVSRFKAARGDLDALDPLITRMWNDGKSVILVKNIFEFPSYLGGRWTLFDKVVHAALDEGITDVATILARSNRQHYDLYKDGATERRVIEANAEIDRLKAAYPRLIVLDRMDYVCAPREETCYSGNARLQQYFPDYGHHTVAGAEFFSGRIDEVGWLDPVLELADHKHTAQNSATQ
ncbi:acyltransferase family protein [Alloyangia pacifica]|uniref:acyltransferase family protein n=1 Tax=Alloyangia pacifica TaxID=311180 RepID=UPI001CFD04E3|nr:acyltransferase family protein [Alloyangia pacifica]